MFERLTAQLRQDRSKLSASIIRRLQEILDQLRCGEPDRVLTLALYPASKIFLVGQDAHQAVLEVESTEASSTGSVGRWGLTTSVMQKLCGIDERC